MEDQISNIVDSKVFTDLDTLIILIEGVEKEIDVVNGKSISIQVDLKGAESLTQLTASINEQKKAVEQLTVVEEKNNVATEQAGKIAVESAAEIASLRKQIEDTQKAWAEYGTKNAQSNKAVQEEIDRLKAKLASLQTQTTQTTRATQELGVHLGKTALTVENFITSIGRALLRFTAFTIVIEGAIKIIELITTSILENITGTDAWIAKQEKLLQSTESLKKSFEDLAETYARIKLLELELKNSLDESAEGLKREANLVKALGILNLQVYNAQRAQLDADNAVREKELQGLNKKVEVYKKLLDVIQHTSMVSNKFTGQMDESILAKKLKSSVPKEAFDKFYIDVAKSEKESGETGIIANLDILIRQYKAATRDIEQVIENNKNSTNVAEQHLATLQRELRDKKEIELQKQLLNTKEQFRQTNEKLEIESVDIIVRDTKAKYMLLAKDIERSKKEYLTHFPAGYTDKNVKSYNELLRLLKLIGAQEQKNATQEFLKQSSLTALGHKSSESATSAKQSEFLTAFGLPSYEAMVETLDKETKAKKDALDFQYEQTRVAYTKNGDDITTLQNQHNKSLEQVDKESYLKRLDLAQQYFDKIASKINTQTQILSTSNSARHFGNITSILNGGDNSVNKDYKLFFEEQAQIQAEANIQLQGVRNKLPEAGNQLDKANFAVKSANSPEEKKNAELVQNTAQLQYDSLIEKQGEYESTIAQSNDAIRRKQIEGINAIRDAALNTMQTVISAENTITLNTIAKQQMQLEIQQQKLKIYTEQRLQSIDATTGFEISKTNQKNKVVAQSHAEENRLQNESNQLKLKAAKAEKKAAELSIIVNTATAISKAFATNPYIVAVPIAALLAAMGAVELAAAESAPLPQFEQGGITSTDKFIAAEGNKPELAVTPSGEVSLLTKEGVYNKPIGTQIFKHSDTVEMIEYARKNVLAGNTDLGIMQQIYNNDYILKEVSKIIGNKFENVGTDIVSAIYNARPMKDNSVADAMREMSNLQSKRK